MKRAVSAHLENPTNDLSRTIAWIPWTSHVRESQIATHQVLTCQMLSDGVPNATGQAHYPRAARSRSSWFVETMEAKGVIYAWWALHSKHCKMRQPAFWAFENLLPQCLQSQFNHEVLVLGTLNLGLSSPIHRLGTKVIWHIAELGGHNDPAGTTHTHSNECLLYTLNDLITLVANGRKAQLWRSHSKLFINATLGIKAKGCIHKITITLPQTPIHHNSVAFLATFISLANRQI